jgi:hypothetical protein
MKWIKFGKVFDPRAILVNNIPGDFAQSPQTIVFDRFVRIYYSTRTKDNKGEFLSHIAFVDMDKDFQKVIGYSQQEVIGFGKLGTFDEHGIFPINPIKCDGRILAYTCGWNRRVSIPVETSIGIAESFDDGKTFLRIGDGPILTSSINEPFLVGDGFVQKYHGMYHMWYIFGKKWISATQIEPVARVYKIGYAQSLDGINWTKNEGVQIIDDVLNENECQALPTVLKIENRYHMYFCFREATDFRKNPKRGYKIGYAFSDDLVNWTRNDEIGGIKCTVDGWDGEMMCYPHICEVDGNVFLLYNGNEFGRYGFGVAKLLSNI